MKPARADASRIASPRHARWRGVALAVALATVTHAAHAALFDDEEARRRIDQTNQRLSQVQRQIEDRVLALEQQLKSQGMVDLLNQIEMLRGDVAKLRGQIEVATYELEQSQKRQRDLYVDLDSRLRRIESQPAQAAAPAGAPGVDAGAPGTAGAPATPGGAAIVQPGATPAPSSPPAAAPSGTVAGTVPPAGALPPAVAPGARPADPAAEQRAYDAALDFFKRGDYTGAINAFNGFLRNYPRSPLASSAQYWIGNAQFARRDFKGAITSQRTLLASYPDSSKAPDALLNIASAQSELGDNGSARRTLEDLIARYPQSDAAQKARQRLGMR